MWDEVRNSREGRVAGVSEGSLQEVRSGQQLVGRWCRAWEAVVTSLASFWEWGEPLKGFAFKKNYSLWVLIKGEWPGGWVRVEMGSHSRSHVDLSLFHWVPSFCPPGLPESYSLSQTKQLCPLKVLVQIQTPGWESASLFPSRIFEKILVFPNNGIYVSCLRKNNSLPPHVNIGPPQQFHLNKGFYQKKMWTLLFCSPFTVPMISLASKSDFTKLQRGSLHSLPSCALFLWFAHTSPAT